MYSVLVIASQPRLGDTLFGNCLQCYTRTPEANCSSSAPLARRPTPAHHLSSQRIWLKSWHVPQSPIEDRFSGRQPKPANGWPEPLQVCSTDRYGSRRCTPAEIRGSGTDRAVRRVGRVRYLLDDAHCTTLQKYLARGQLAPRIICPSLRRGDLEVLDVRRGITSRT